MSDLLKKLAGETGLGMAPCSIALEEANGDYGKALSLLKTHGARLAVDVIERRRKEHEERRKKLAEATTEEERPHHAESASSLQPKEWCPRFQNGSTTSEAAELGTRQHYAAETGDLSGLDDDEAEKVMMVRTFIADRVAELKKTYPDVRQENEVYGQVDEIEWPTMNERSTSGGFVDVVLVFDGGKQVEIWDYKFGKWAVEAAEHNLQGIVYLLNHRNRYPMLEKARVGFLMPYLEKIDYHDFTSDQFEALYVRVKRLVALRQLGRNLEENPSWHTCMWCANLWNCKKVGEMMRYMGSKFAPLKVPKDPSLSKINASIDATAWIQWAEVCKAYGSSVRQQITEEVTENPELCPTGHSLIHATDREIKNSLEFIEFMITDVGIPEEDVKAQIKLSLGSGEKLIKNLAPRGEKETFCKEVLARAEAKGIIVPGKTKIYLKANRQGAED